MVDNEDRHARILRGLIQPADEITILLIEVVLLSLGIPDAAQGVNDHETDGGSLLDGRSESITKPVRHLRRLVEKLYGMAALSLGIEAFNPSLNPFRIVFEAKAQAITIRDTKVIHTFVLLRDGERQGQGQITFAMLRLASEDETAFREEPFYRPVRIWVMGAL